MKKCRNGLFGQGKACTFVPMRGRITVGCTHVDLSVITPFHWKKNGLISHFIVKKTIKTETKTTY